MEIKIGQYWLWKDRQVIIKIIKIFNDSIKFDVIYDNDRPSEIYNIMKHRVPILFAYLQLTPCTYDEAEQKYPEYFI